MGKCAAILFSVLATAVAAAELPPDISSRPGAVAMSRVREMESIVRLTAEGESLFRADAEKKTGYQYCSASSAFSEKGEFRRAIREAAKALFLGIRNRDDDVLAHAKRDLAIAYSYSGDLDKAEEYAEQALKHYVAQRNRAAVFSRAYKVLGDVAMRRGDPAKAIALYRKSIDAADDDLRFYSRNSLALAYIEQGQLKLAGEALATAESYVDVVAERGRAGARGVLLRARANLAFAEGKFGEAEAMYSAAIGRAAATAGADAAYERFWGHEGIGRSRQAKGDRSGAIEAYREAIAVSEQVRARFRSDEIKAGLFGQMQQAFDEAVSLLLESGQVETAWEVSEQGRSRALLDLVRNRVAQSAGSTVFADPLARRPRLAELVSGLADGDTLVEYHVTGRKTHAWAIRRSGISSVTIDLPRAALEKQVAAFRDALIERKPEAAELGARLYAALLAPLAIRAGDHLIVVPHDALHYLPFHALRADGRYLVETNSMSYVPSAGARVAVAERGAAGKGGLLALANPDLGDPALALPGAQAEVEQIRTFFPDAAVYFRGDATKRRLLQNAAHSRIVHVAAHAEADPVDPLYSRIHLAGSDGQPGTLEAHEVFAIDLGGASLVTLSACESGLGKVSRGDEIWGFTRSFLSAGSAAVLVSLWPVADEATAMLMTRFYQGLAGKGARRALRDAQIEVMRDARFSQPFFWAPFELVGSPG